MIEMPISSDLFKQSMRLLAGGVCIVATHRDGERYGLTMTAVCSPTADLPSLIACVNRDAGAHGIMCETKLSASMSYPAIMSIWRNYFNLQRSRVPIDLIKISGLIWRAAFPPWSMRSLCLTGR